MRSGLRIRALSERGKVALLEHRRERMRESWTKRQVFDQLYRERVVSEVPFVLEIEHRVARIAELVPFESLVIPIRVAMRENGAREGVDYEVVPL